MKNIILPICCAAALCMVPTLMSGCNSDPKDGSAPDGPPIDVCLLYTSDAADD